MTVRVRFAPSPTGFLHVGGLRTALYNYLFAKHHNGTCVLRIEDTDRTRFVENATENLIAALKWAGIEFDESLVEGGDYGPYVQSERFDLYREHAEILIKTSNAYYAFDTPDELTAMRERRKKEGGAFQYDRDTMRNQMTLGDEECKRLLDAGEAHVVRLNVPHDKSIDFSDMIRGNVSMPGKDVDDQILIKSDGFPTYHLANVVDDHLMKISHVIRGEEWLPSTPKHVLLYDAFGWDRPEFAHLPLLLNQDKSKLSKRTGSVGVEEFRTDGYFKDAFVNFVALLGWNPTADREIYDIEELIELFNIEKVNKAGAVFDRKKLEWMNFEYLKKMETKELADLLKPILVDKEYDICAEYITQVVDLFRERVHFVHEFAAIADYMFVKPTEFEEKYANKHWKEDTVELMKPLIEIYKNEDNFEHEHMYEVTKEYVESKEIKFKQIIHPIRLMITGKSAGAGMFETMEVLGKEECIERFESYINNL